MQDHAGNPREMNRYRPRGVGIVWMRHRAVVVTFRLLFAHASLARHFHSALNNKVHAGYLSMTMKCSAEAIRTAQVSCHIPIK